MSRDAEQFAETIGKVRDVESHSEGEYIHKYDAVLEETGESVRVITLAPQLADDEDATDPFERVTGQWYNANTHPNIVSIVEREMTPRPWIAVDQPHDCALPQVQSQLTPTELETVVTDTVEALRTLGLYNAVHGSLVPADILVSPDGDDTTVHVRGFGLEHAVRTAVDESPLTPYTAPELLENPDQPTEQTDVYGLGAITYFALTGQSPVDSEHLEQAIRDGPIFPPSEYNDEVEPALDDAVMRALSTHPQDRQDSPHAFKRSFLSSFDADSFETGDDTDEDADRIDQSTIAEDADEGDEGTDQQAPNDNKENKSRRTRRAVLSLFGTGAIGGAGVVFLRNQPFSSENAIESNQLQNATKQPTTETETPEETDINPTQQAKIERRDNETSRYLGTSVAVSTDGDIALIGAPDWAEEEEDGGSVYIFENTDSSWSRQAKLTPNVRRSGNTFGAAVAISSDDTVALIGAPTSGNGAGSAFVFEYTGESWSQQDKLVPDDVEPGDRFGHSVAVSNDGSTVFINSRRDNLSGSQHAGSAYIYEKSGDSWSRQTKLTAGEDSEELSYFGSSAAVSEDGTTALIGATNESNDEYGNVGSAYVFEGSGGSWTRQAKLIPADGDSADEFGWSVAISSDGTTALIGAHSDDDPNGHGYESGSGAGSAYVFEQADESWSQQAKLAAEDGDSGDNFGSSVAISSDGNLALIGAKGDEDPNGSGALGGAGSVYIFDNSGESWTQQAKFAADDGDVEDSFGNAVAVSSDGSTALVGASLDENPDGSKVGSAYVFSI